VSINCLRSLTTASNDVVRRIHAKAMPVLLTTEHEFDTWLDGSINDAIALERLLSNELLRIVTTSEKSDYAPSEAYRLQSSPQSEFGPNADFPWDRYYF
jgi:putative SOS response-associated peptidase YedK